MSCFDQTCVLVRPDVCLDSTRRVSCFDQTCVLVRPDGCPVSIRRVSWFDQTGVLFRSDVCLGLSRQLISAHLGSSRQLISAHRLVSVCSSRHYRSSRLIGSSRLALLGISLVLAHRLVSACSSWHPARLGSSARLLHQRLLYLQITIVLVRFRFTECITSL